MFLNFVGVPVRALWTPGDFTLTSDLRVLASVYSLTIADPTIYQASSN